MIDINNLSKTSYDGFLIVFAFIIVSLILISMVKHYHHPKIAKYLYFGAFIITILGFIGVGKSIYHDSKIETAQILKTRKQQIKQVANYQKQITKLQLQSQFYGIKAEQTLDNKQIKKYLNQQNQVNQQTSQIKTKINALNKKIKAVSSNGTPTN